MTADDVIARLGLEPHPEGGHYAETYRHTAEGGGRHTAEGGGRHSAEGGGRGACTAIYYLLRAGERSHWHAVDAVEVWTWHAGAPLRLRIADGGTVTDLVLGPDLAAGQRPQAVVPAEAWQAAEPLGEWVLVGCIVAPAFQFEGFRLAPPGWEPNGEPT